MGDYLHEVNVCNFLFCVGSRQQLLFVIFRQFCLVIEVKRIVRVNEKYDFEFRARNSATYCAAKPNKNPTKILRTIVLEVETIQYRIIRTTHAYNCVY